MSKKLDYKIKVLQSAMEKQHQIIEDYKASIDDFRESEMNVNEDQYDYNQGSLDSGSNEMINKLADELNFVLEEMDLLIRLKSNLKITEHVALGSIVKTDKRNFFPSVSIEEFDVDGIEFFGISGKAPLFLKMKGKEKGDSFSFKGQNYLIQEVY